MLTEILGREQGATAEDVAGAMDRIINGTDEVYFEGHPRDGAKVWDHIDWLYRLLSACHGLIAHRAKGTEIERGLLLMIRRTVPGLAEKIASDGGGFVDENPVPGPTPNPPSEVPG